jgi:hypothetical protein
VTAKREWWRICVDVDPNGNVQGASYEVHRDDEIAVVSTLTFGPFDEMATIVWHAYETLRKERGTQQTFF